MPEPAPIPSFIRRAMIAVAIAVAALILVYFLWQAAHVLLLVFAGVLLAIFLRTLAEALFNERGSSPVMRVEADNEAVIRSLVVAGSGVALMREDVAKEAADLILLGTRRKRSLRCNPRLEVVV